MSILYEDELQEDETEHEEKTRGTSIYGNDSCWLLCLLDSCVIEYEDFSFDICSIIIIIIVIIIAIIII